MTYHITYHADGWVRAATGAPELRQVGTADLGDGSELVVILVCGIDGGSPRVAEARWRHFSPRESQVLD